MFATPGSRVQRKRPWVRDVTIVFDNAGAAITSTQKAIYVPVDFTGILQQVTMVADLSGNITMDVLKCTFAQFDAGSTHPVSGDSMTGNTGFALSSALKLQDPVLASWTNKRINAGDVLALICKTTASAATRVTVSLKILVMV
jgi:hypothetical protein